MSDNLNIFKNVLRVLWAAAGLLFIWTDIAVLGNSQIAPSFWLIMGVVAFFGAVMGMTGGIGMALITQGVLKYRQYTFFQEGTITFAPEFTLFDKVAHGFFIGYGIFLIVLQIRKSIRKRREVGDEERQAINQQLK